MEPILRTESLAKAFADVRAVDGVSVSFQRGETTAIVGGNGSGKSTFLNLLAGLLQPDAGKIFVDGMPATFRHPSAAMRYGVALVCQDDGICPELSVADNVVLGNETGTGRNPWISFVSRAQIYSRAKAAFQRVTHGDISLQRPAGTLSGGQKKAVIIARSLLWSPSVLLLDEPTNSLGVSEQKELFSLVRKFRDQGLCVVYVSHRIREVLEVADKVVALDNGRVAKIANRADINEVELARLMAGNANE